jgi:hypothetical protein
MVDHLVTFIACEFVTAARIAEILGCHPARFRRIHKTEARGPGEESGFAALRHWLSHHASDCMSGFPD